MFDRPSDTKLSLHSLHILTYLHDNIELENKKYYYDFMQK